MLAFRGHVSFEAPGLECPPCVRERRMQKKEASASFFTPSTHQAFGNVTPCCPWYLPPRSLYEVSQTSSLSKNSTCAQPSPA
jgi:hypothetical protein